MGTSLHRMVLLFQGIYYVITGLWPLVNVRSFEAVTGKKKDTFTLDSTGLLIVVIGAVLALASRQRRPDPALTVLGVATATSLAGVEIAYARRVRPIYLIEAAGELGLASVLLGTRLFLNGRHDRLT